MKVQKVRDTSRNFICSMFRAAVTTVMPFLVRTFLIRFIGIEYTGVSSLFTSVLQILNLADLGIATATVYFLYEPVASGDWKRINAIMNLFRKLYRGIGLVILVLGLLLIPVLPFLVKGKAYPADLNITAVYILYILDSALGYLLYGHIVQLYSASEEYYHVPLIGGVGALLMYLCQLIAVCVLRNFYLYASCMLANHLSQLLLYEIRVRRDFPLLRYEGKPSRDFIRDFEKRLFAIALSKLRNVSRNSFDSVVISAFIGLSVLAVYQNYYQIMLVPVVILGVLHSAFAPVLGNGVATESRENTYANVRVYSLIQNGLVTVCISCFMNLCQPFMKLWVGEEYLMPFALVIYLCVYFYVLSVADTAALLRETTGIWWQGRFIAVVEAAANLILNIVLVQWIGVYGVVLATIVTILFINIPFEYHYVFRYYFESGVRQYTGLQVRYCICTAVTAAVSWLISSRIPAEGIGGLLLRLIASLAIPGGLFLLLHVRDREFSSAVKGILSMVRKKK